MSAVPKAIPTAVAISTNNSVPVLKGPQLGPYQPMSGSTINPVVPRTEVDGEEDTPPNPRFGGNKTSGIPREGGSEGAPSVPTDGYLFTAGPIDSHYQIENQGGRNPYRKINNPRTNGYWTRIQEFANNAAHSVQDVGLTGWRVRPGQQRTSVMLNALPPMAGGFGTESYVPRQMPQQPNTYKYAATTGINDPGTLNTTTLGAGQTAGGVGGNQYTPTPGPPDTNPVTNGGNTGGGGGMPVWG